MSNKPRKNVRKPRCIRNSRAARLIQLASNTGDDEYAFEDNPPVKETGEINDICPSGCKKLQTLKWVQSSDFCTEIDKFHGNTDTYDSNSIDFGSNNGTNEILKELQPADNVDVLNHIKNFETNTAEKKNREELQAVGHEELQPVGNEELQAVDNEELQAVDNKELQAVGNEELQPVGNEELQAVDNEELKSVDNEELQAVGNKEVQAVGNEELQPVGNEELQAVGNKELQAVDNEELQAVANKELQAVGNEKLQPVGQKELQTVDNEAVDNDSEKSPYVYQSSSESYILNSVYDEDSNTNSDFILPKPKFLVFDEEEFLYNIKRNENDKKSEDRNTSRKPEKKQTETNTSEKPKANLNKTTYNREQKKTVISFNTEVLDGQNSSNITEEVNEQNICGRTFQAKILDEYIQDSNKKKKKKTCCKFCENFVTNFERHLVRHHTEEKEVQEYLSYSTKTKEDKNMRKKILGILRYEKKFDNYVRNTGAINDSERLPCIHCKKFVATKYLRRHHKVCSVKPFNEPGVRVQHKALSQTLLACASDSASASAAVRVRKEVFPKMKADQISLVAKTDPLIRHFGENYLKKHKRAQIATVCSNKLRECARLLIEMRRRINKSDFSFLEVLNTKLFDHIVASAKAISGYTAENKIFKAPSLAMHLGTLLKQLCDLSSHLIIKGVFKCCDIEEKLKDIKRLKNMVESQWSCEISSLAIKDMAEKKWNKPVRLPLTKDVITFRNHVLNTAAKCMTDLRNEKKDEKAYKKLMESALTLTILFNRRRIGDVQYVTIESYLKDYQTLDQTEFLEQLTESEKLLTKSYKRVVAGGKGSRAIVILFPRNVQDYIQLLLQIRNETEIIPKENPYLFAYPHAKDQWIRADVVIRKFAKASNLENPEAITSNLLRKQIATLMQIINLSKEEYSQFAKFMGHTEKTHQDFYEITQDAYQTAKVSKLLSLFDKGQGSQYKGMPLENIELDTLEKEFAEADLEKEFAETDLEKEFAEEDMEQEVANVELENEAQEKQADGDETDDRRIIKRSKRSKSKSVEKCDGGKQSRTETHSGLDIDSIEPLPGSSQYCREDNDNYPVLMKNSKTKDKKKAKSSNRVRWSEKQKSIVKNHFKKHIKSKTSPKKEECLEIIEKYKDIFYNLDWVKVKTFVYNIYSNNYVKK